MGEKSTEPQPQGTGVGVSACGRIGERKTRRLLAKRPASLLLETGAKQDASPTRQLAIEQLTTVGVAP